MAAIRKKIVLTEVSFCKSGMHPMARIALRKEDDMAKPKLEIDLSKVAGLTDEQRKEIAKAIADGAEKAFDGLVAKSDAEKTEKDIADQAVADFVGRVAADDKASLEVLNAERVKKGVPVLAKAEPKTDNTKDELGLTKAERETTAPAVIEMLKEGKANAARIEKMEKAAKREALVKSADFAPAIAKDEKAIDALEKLAEGEREVLLKHFRAQAEQLAKNNLLLKEVGASAPAPGSATERVEALAKAAIEKDPKLNKHAARAAIFEGNPQLKAEYTAEQRKAH